MIGPRVPAARAALGAFFIAMIAVHALIAWQSPVLADDWRHWMWSADHAGDSAGEFARAFAAAHYTLSDLIGFALAQSTLFHTIVSPLVGVALILGLVTFATRRLPRPDAWSDVVAIILVSALIWIAAPRAGLVWFYRPNAAIQIYGVALALWVLAPYRCRWQPRGAAAWLLLAGGYFAGTSTRQLGLAALGGAIYAIQRTPRTERRRWMWLGLFGLAIGTLAGFLDDPPDVRVVKRGFESSLGALNLSIREGGELIALVLVLVFARLLLAKLRPAGGDRDAPDTSETARWFGLWFGLSMLALFGPRYSEAMLFVPTLVLCIAALPVLVWVMASRLRAVVVAIAVGVHLVVWPFALSIYIPAGAEYRARMATLEDAPAGGVAVLRPYRELTPSFWFFGEDWSAAGGRQLAAIKIFGLRDIELAPWYRRLESNPGLDFRLELAGVTPQQLRAADAPALWATELGVARDQLEQLAKRLEATLGKQFTARLVIANLRFAELRGRPLIAAAYENGAALSLASARAPYDDKNRQFIRVPSRITSAYPEAYLVIGDRASLVEPYRNGYRIQVMTRERHALVVCNPARCVAIDVYVPLL